MIQISFNGFCLGQLDIALKRIVRCASGVCGLTGDHTSVSIFRDGQHVVALEHDETNDVFLPLGRWQIPSWLTVGANEGGSGENMDLPTVVDGWAIPPELVHPIGNAREYPYAWKPRPVYSLPTGSKQTVDYDNPGYSFESGPDFCFAPPTFHDPLAGELAAYAQRKLSHHNNRSRRYKLDCPTDLAPHLPGERGSSDRIQFLMGYYAETARHNELDYCCPTLTSPFNLLEFITPG